MVRTKQNNLLSGVPKNDPTNSEFPFNNFTSEDLLHRGIAPFPRAGSYFWLVTMNNQALKTFQQHINSFIEALLDALPAMLGAIILIILGWLLARVVRFLLSKLLRSLNRLFLRNARWKGLQGIELEGPLLNLIPRVVYWFVIFFFLIGAADLLGLQVFTKWVNKIITILPLLFVGFIIILTGIGVGQVARNLLVRKGAMGHVPYGSIIGSALQIAIVLISVIVALNTAGVNLSFLTTLIAVVLGGFLLTAAIAFGLGSRHMINNIIAGHFTGKIYQVGHRVEIDGTRGTILKIEAGFIIIETQEGEVSIPASDFLEKQSKKLT
jgi:small-conductance mechanosensitive channel